MGGTKLVQLPEKVRGVLEKLVRKLSAQETVSGIALFGSWSRGDAVPSSDVDLLIVNGRVFNYEYVERLETNGLLIDLDYIPKKLIKGSMPPEMDQKIYEMLILYDRDWSLTDTKNWVSKAYATPERLDIRTENYVIESDLYLSRATSALVRGDFQSARVFASMGVEAILKILIDINLMPISNSHFIQVLEEATKRSGMPEFFAGYLTLARLQAIDRLKTERKLNLLKEIWGEITSFTEDHASTLDSLHFKTKTRLRYYGKPAFLEGLTARSQAIMDTEMFDEAAHYMLRTLVDMLENYAWLASAEEGAKLNYPTLFRSLMEMEKPPMRIYEAAVEAFNVVDADREGTEKAVKFAKNTNLNLRQQRKDLIKKFIKPVKPHA
jgi:predicted nucleotidyltransferase